MLKVGHGQYINPRYVTSALVIERDGKAWIVVNTTDGKSTRLSESFDAFSEADRYILSYIMDEW